MRSLLALLAVSLPLSGCASFFDGLKTFGDSMQENSRSPSAQPYRAQQPQQDADCFQYKQMTVYGVNKMCYVQCNGTYSKEYQCN
jgi:hypothetical protein